MDTFTPSQRSKVMRRVKSENTKPEMVVRRLVYAMGRRYRLHDKSLPGKPDMVFKGAKKIIFVHGCFWHWHDCPRGRRMPKSHTEYWEAKIRRNIERDREHQRQLEEMGYDVLVVWECQTKDIETLREKLRIFLKTPGFREAET